MPRADKQTGAVRRLWFPAVLLAAALGAVALSLGGAGDRPMHTDEAVNAVRLGGMLAGETLRYDPQDMHGPTLLFSAWPVVRLCGATTLAQMEAWHVRTVPALCLGLLVLALAWYAEWLGRAAVAAALPWFVLGAPFVYFGGMFIHEMLIALLVVVLVALMWSYFHGPGVGLALAAGAAAGLLMATKEIAPVTLVVLGLAWFGCRLTARRLPGVAGGSGTSSKTRPERTEDRAHHHESAPAEAKRALRRDLPLALAVAAGVAALFYASFGANPAGPLDAVRGWVRFIGRAAGEGHERAWFGYAQWFLTPNVRAFPWFGWTLLACFGAGAVVAYRRRREQSLAWFLVLYAVATAVVYSATPYKTPWLALNFFVPAALVAGFGCAIAWRGVDARLRPAAVGIWTVALAIVLGLESRQLCFRFPVDATNPLAYSPTVPDVERLPALIERRLGDRPAGAAPALVQVIGDDYWPLPWYLRRFERVGYWPALLADVRGDVIVATGETLQSTADELGPAWQADYAGLRPNVLAIAFTRRKSPSEAGADE